MAISTIFAVIDKYMVGLPDHPLDPSKLPMTLDLGGTSAVIETYPGHTSTDIIVRVPEQNIVFTGDLLFNGWYPVAFDANNITHLPMYKRARKGIGYLSQERSDFRRLTVWENLMAILETLTGVDPMRLELDPETELNRIDVNIGFAYGAANPAAATPYLRRHLATIQRIAGRNPLVYRDQEGVVSSYELNTFN